MMQEPIVLTVGEVFEEDNPQTRLIPMEITAISTTELQVTRVSANYIRLGFIVQKSTINWLCWHPKGQQVAAKPNPPKQPEFKNQPSGLSALDIEELAAWPKRARR